MGALVSILIIWGLVIALIYEASERIAMIVRNEEIFVDGKIMLITACISLLCNMFNLWALGECCGNHEDGLLENVNSVFKPHGHSHAHDHGHSHGGHSHGHSHAHNHSHSNGNSHSDEHENSHGDHKHQSLEKVHESHKH